MLFCHFNRFYGREKNAPIVIRTTHLSSSEILRYLISFELLQIVPIWINFHTFVLQWITPWNYQTTTLCTDEEWIDQLVLTRMKSCGVHSSMFTYLCKKGFAVCTFPTNKDIVWILINPMKINGHLDTKTVEQLHKIFCTYLYYECSSFLLTGYLSVHGMLYVPSFRSWVIISSILTFKLHINVDLRYTNRWLKRGLSSFLY